MSLRSKAMPYAAMWLTDRRLARLRERLSVLGRDLRGGPREARFYFRVDDPTSWLLAQQLPALCRETGLRIAPRTLLHLPSEMYPEPELYRRYAVRDAELSAALHGLEFAAGAPPSFDDALTASRILLAHERDPDFVRLAATLARHLFRGEVDAIEALAAGAVSEAAAREELERRRDRFLDEGHYLTGTLHYGGVWYWGPDRLDHLRERLARERGEAMPDSALAWRGLRLGDPPRDAEGEPLELFFSFRSPYSYLALERTLKLCAHYRLALRVRPVLPMVMRGLRVPPTKRFYILKDAAREAARAGVPFGRVCDPVGAGVERCMAIWPLAEREERLAPFIVEAGRAIWSRGVDVSSDAGLAAVVEAAGLRWPDAREALRDEGWRRRATENRDAMMAAGSWGVPTFRFRGVTLWGQDRIPTLERLLLGEIRA